jgi:hypothetical protein
MDASAAGYLNYLQTKTSIYVSAGEVQPKQFADVK